MMNLVLLLIAVLITATISGVFGMAGGLLLMGALALTLPVSAAMITHGAVQLVSNGWRAVLHRAHIKWPIIGYFALGAALAIAALAFLTYQPTKPWLYLMLGLVPALSWLPKQRLNLDAADPPQAALCGALVSGLNVIAGVSGPLLDVFFVRTALTRHQIVATKAATQSISHCVKIGFYGFPLLAAAQPSGLPPAWFFIAAAPLAMAGAVLGGRMLDAMTDKSFLKWTRLIVTGIGAAYVVQALQLFWRGNQLIP